MTRANSPVGDLRRARGGRIPRSRKIHAICLAALLVVPAVYSTYASETDEVAPIPMSFLEKEEVRALIPLELISPTWRERVGGMLEDHTLFVDAERNTFRSTMDTYEYLFEELPFAIKLVNVLDLQQYEVRPEGKDRFGGGDGRHIVGHFETIWKERGKRIFYGWGYYDSALLPKVNGETIFILLYDEIEGEDGALMDNKLYAYFRVDNAVLGAILKLVNIAFPTVVQRKLTEVFVTGRVVAELVTTEPEGMYALLLADPRFTDEEREAFRRAFLTSR